VIPPRAGPSVLERIVAARRADVERARAATPLADVRRQAEAAPPAVSLRAALAAAPGIALIAEMKRASPSAGPLDPYLDPAAAARVYAHSGAAAISVLTECEHFGGSVEDLRAAKGAVAGRGVPVLAKDFVLDEYQVWEARANGADAVLLIAAILDRARYASLLRLTHELGMEALVECFTEQEIDLALAQEPRVVGVNNRSLHTLETSLETFERLAPVAAARMPPDGVLVAESGMRTVEDVRRMVRAGARAVLVGEGLMRARSGVAALVRAMAAAE